MIIGHCDVRSEKPAVRFDRPALLALCLVALAGTSPALSKDDDEEDAKPGSTLPNVYLDLTTSYATIPANSLSIGFRPTLPTLSSTGLALPAAQGSAYSAPLTIDINDRLSVYGGVNGSAFRPDGGAWSALLVDSWSIGFQSDVYQQNGGMLPTVTLQSTLSKSILDSPFASTSVDSIVELDYALNEDETRGLLGGVRYTKITLHSDIGRIDSPVTGYLGGYYQWPSNWKASVRAGIQSFGGARVGALTPIKPFTQPILRFDLDRMDDNDNRLFGVSAQIAWTPTPSYLLVLRTPMYLVGP